MEAISQEIQMLFEVDFTNNAKAAPNAKLDQSDNEDNTKDAG